MTTIQEALTEWNTTVREIIARVGGQRFTAGETKSRDINADDVLINSRKALPMALEALKMPGEMIAFADYCSRQTFELIGQLDEEDAGDMEKVLPIGNGMFTAAFAAGVLWERANQPTRALRTPRSGQDATSDGESSQ